jgi:hypothetical protein
MLSTYSYDKLNRLKQDQPYTMVNNASTVASKWSSSYSYDPDGNIKNLMRDDGNGSGIDNLSYVYPASGGKTINNRLNHIVDHTTGNGGGSGVVTQNPGNYSYDATGNRVVKDYHATQNTTLTSRTWTIRDAQGTVLGIYTCKPSVGTSKREWQPTKAITSDEFIENGLKIKLTEVIKLRRLVMSQGVNSGSKKDSISMTE